MIVIWGARLYGKVDEVPGLFHVATKFGHLYYLPLLPMESHLVLTQDSKGWRGVRINMRWKSVFVAWLRTGLVAAAMLMAVMGLVILSERRASFRWEGVVMEILAALLMGGAVWTWFAAPIRKAGYERAVALADRAGLSDEARILIERHFGRITDEQAMAELERAARDRAEMERLQSELAAAPPRSPPTSPPVASAG